MPAVPKPDGAHNKLQDDVCAWLRQWQAGWIPVKEMDLGSRSLDKEVKRADVFAMSETYRPRFVICEIKVSRADFLRGVREEQHLIYAEFCNVFYFATPHGLITEDEVPPGCGWLEEREWPALQGSNKTSLYEEQRGEENRAFKMNDQLWQAFVKRLAS